MGCLIIYRLSVMTLLKSSLLQRQNQIMESWKISSKLSVEQQPSTSTTRLPSFTPPRPAIFSLIWQVDGHKSILLQTASHQAGETPSISVLLMVKGGIS